MAQYRALVGLDYPPNKRVEAGEIVSDLPGNSIKWLLESGAIESVDGKKETPKPKEETKEEPKEETKQQYKPDAIDGDKDGLVQDGTPFQRPVGTELTPEEIKEKAGE